MYIMVLHHWQQGVGGGGAGQLKIQPNFQYINIQIDGLKNAESSFLPKHHNNSINLYKQSCHIH